MDASPIQVINTIFNLFSVINVIIMTSIVWGYKRRVKQRYDEINKRLGHILLLLSNEVYQSEVKGKTSATSQELRRKIN